MKQTIGYEYSKIIPLLFEKHGYLKKYKKKHLLFGEEDSPGKCYFIKRGLVKMSQSTVEGYNVTFFLRNKREFFGIIELILNIPRQRYAQCLTDTILWEMDKSVFLDLIGNNPKINHLFFQMVSNRLLLMQKSIGNLMSKPVHWRLAWLLKQLSENEDGNKKNEITLHNLPTHEEISNIIGCSRQTVSENLSNWRKMGLINYKKKKMNIFNIENLFMSSL